MEKSKLVKLAAAGVAVLAIAGYIGLQQWANGKADREIKRMLIESDLDRVIRYGGVSASIFGRSVTLSDVSITAPDGRGAAITVKKAVVSDLDTYRDSLTAARLKLESLSLPLLDMAKTQRNGGADASLARLVGMGYPSLTGGVEFYFRLDPDKQRGVVELSSDFEDFGGASFKLGLDRLDPRFGDFSRAIRDAVKTQNPLVLLQDAPAMMDVAARLELADLSVGVKDRGIRKRLLAETAEDGLVTEDPDRIASAVGAATTKELRSQLDGLRVDPKLSADIASTVGQYVESGGELKLTTRIDRPIPLFERGGFLGIQPSPFLMSLDRFFALTGARLER